ncbi:hypothetical protein FA95DRAFT_1609516 [Auriscalpium vulgare]|uniref:Uncharacterized protein n=1 Tax=Auriscalpium vulgare TaxID=40419 RepID=A0ACB8RGZ7_9AGAM|nr:hypothetical protein FA95DRAFT_1609516 [Auriscalpium vulgare]
MLGATVTDVLDYIYVDVFWHPTGQDIGHDVKVAAIYKGVIQFFPSCSVLAVSVLLQQRKSLESAARKPKDRPEPAPQSSLPPCCQLRAGRSHDRPDYRYTATHPKIAQCNTAIALRVSHFCRQRTIPDLNIKLARRLPEASPAHGVLLEFGYVGLTPARHLRPNVPSPVPPPYRCAAVDIPPPSTSLHAAQCLHRQSPDHFIHGQLWWTVEDDLKYRLPPGASKRTREPAGVLAYAPTPRR